MAGEKLVQLYLDCISFSLCVLADAVTLYAATVYPLGPDYDPGRAAVIGGT